ncbi:MAG TPA: hypothetical protein VIY26_09770 [Acidimicrobiales bacterium]
MHANVVQVEIKDVDDATKGVAETVIPNLKQAPGFVGAYFVALDGSHGMFIAVFATEEQAKAAAPAAGAMSPGVTLIKSEIGPVVGAA